MASGPSVAAARELLDYILADDVEVRLWTTAPAFDGTGGVEVTGGGYAPALLLAAPAAAGTAGVIARAPSNNVLSFADMPVASDGVHGITIHRLSDGTMRWLDDGFAAAGAWAIGEAAIFNVGQFGVEIVPAS